MEQKEKTSNGIEPLDVFSHFWNGTVNMNTLPTM